MSQQSLAEGMEQAKAYKRLVSRRTRLKRQDLVCPRERSEMTPCIARDGSLAVAAAHDGPVCVGCNHRVQVLLAQEQARHKEA